MAPTVLFYASIYRAESDCWKFMDETAETLISQRPVVDFVQTGMYQHLVVNKEGKSLANVYALHIHTRTHANTHTRTGRNTHRHFF